MSTRISRRTVLRGIGTAIALPSLEAMWPRNSYGAPVEAAPPLRMAFLSVPNGAHMPDWNPAEEGENFAVPKILEPVAKFKSDMLILSGLALDGGRAHGDGPGDHARSCASFLTGAHPKKTDGADITNGISVDQAAAAKIGHLTRFPSLELGIERGAQSGSCDSGYSCAYSANISWRTASTPVPKEVDPAAVFERLFGNGDKGEQGKVRAKKDQYRRSILDFALEDAKRLQKQLGVNDQRKLDEYLYAVRDVERRLLESEKLRGQRPDVPDSARPAGVPREFADHVQFLFDMMALAFQTDSTRIITFMYANEGSNRNYTEVGVNEGHHDLSHHGRDNDKQAKISKINRYHITLLAHLLEKLATIKEGERRLLDQCVLVYGSGLGDGNRHNHDDLPIALFGQAGGAIKTGRHVRYPEDTPLTNLYMSLLEIAGAPTPKFSDSTGKLSHLT